MGRCKVTREVRDNNLTEQVIFLEGSVEDKEGSCAAASRKGWYLPGQQRSHRRHEKWQVLEEVGGRQVY